MANVDAANYVEKTNMRRSEDQEIRREGYLKFAPLDGYANQHVFDAALTCYRIVELIRPNGDKVVIGLGRTVIKRFQVLSGTWDTIGSGYSANGKRWQVETINGTLVLNNGVDLPVYYNYGDAAVTPLKELREVGVASVGRIKECNGFLIIADVTEVIDYQLDAWMRGYADFTVTLVVPEAATFAMAAGDSTHQFNVTTGATPRSAQFATGFGPTSTNTFYVWIKKVDVGIGDVTMDYGGLAGPAIDLININDTALIWWDVINKKYQGVYFAGGVIPATDPYGLIPSAIAITQRIPWQVSNSEYGDPTRWAPAFQVLKTSASASIVLPFPSSVFVKGVTRVAVINAGPLGGVLGGQEATPNGVLVTNVVGRTLTLQVSTDVDLAYPRLITVMRWTDVSSLVGRYLLQGDNSEITSLATLRDWLVVTRTTGIYLGRYTGDPNAPFVFTPAYHGSNVPLWPDAIANVTGDYLLYPARGNRIFKYDATSWPQVHQVTDDAKSLFFTGYDQADEVFAADNEITKEIWFMFPDKTVAFDYATTGGTVSVIDQLFNAAAMVHRPLSTDFWFILSIGRFIYTYGLVFGIAPIQTWLRDAVAVEATLLYGLWSAGDQGHEKLLRELTPIFASQSPDTAVEVEIGATHNPNVAVTQKLVPPEALPTPSGRNYVTCAIQAIYLQPRLTITDVRDRDCRLTEVILEAEIVGGYGGVTRSVN